MQAKPSYSLNNIGNSIYPLRILGFLLFAISILLSYSKLGIKLDAYAIVGIAICLIYPHIIFWRYKAKGEKRDVEIMHMYWDMGVQGVMAALVSFTPSVILPYLIANSAANYALRGVKQALKAVVLSIFVASLVGIFRNESIAFHANPVELIGPFIYLFTVTHFMGYLAYVRGISLIRRKLKAEELSQIDFLTKLNNRRSVLKQVELRKKSNPDNQVTSLIMIDLDHFKKINDQYGHDHGDVVLVQVSNLLQKALRQTDIIARWGGEEFLVLLPDTNLTQATNLAEKIKNQIASHPIPFSGMEHKVTATLGVSSYTTNSDFESTLQSADKALYLGKEQGRNRVIQVGETDL